MECARAIWPNRDTTWACDEKEMKVSECYFISNENDSNETTETEEHRTTNAITTTINDKNQKNKKLRAHPIQHGKQSNMSAATAHNQNLAGYKQHHLGGREKGAVLRILLRQKHSVARQSLLPSKLNSHNRIWVTTNGSGTVLSAQIQLLTTKSERGQLCSTSCRRKGTEPTVRHSFLQPCIENIQSGNTMERSHSLPTSHPSPRNILENHSP